MKLFQKLALHIKAMKQEEAHQKVGGFRPEYSASLICQFQQIRQKCKISFANVVKFV